MFGDERIALEVADPDPLARATNNVTDECNHYAGPDIVAIYCVHNVYNVHGQLISRTTPLTAAPTPLTPAVFVVDTWSYDGVGGQLSSSTVAGVTTTYTYAPTSGTVLSGSSLAGGQSMGRGSALKSANAACRLGFQNDQNLVVYHGSEPVWSLPAAAGSGATSLVMQTDGNLVLYNGPTVIWNSGTWGKPGASLSMQDDCNLVIRHNASVVWATNSVTYGATTYSSRLVGGQSMSRGHTLKSAHGACRVEFQNDQNVVVYDGAEPVWWVPGAAGSGANLFAMQTDGNLVLYNGPTVIWSSGTSGKPGASLSMQDDCNLVIRHNGNPVWASYVARPTIGIDWCRATAVNCEDPTAPTGDLYTMTLATGGSRTFTYNRWGQVATVSERNSATSPSVLVQSAIFDKIGRTVQVEGPTVTNPITGTHRNRVVYTYTSWGPLQHIDEMDALNPTNTRRTTLAHDLQGREHTRIDAEGGQTTRFFDRNGNVTKVCDARGKCVRSVYNAANQLTSTWAVAYNGGADVRLSAFTYDPGGRVSTVTDANGTVVHHLYDAADRRVASTLANIDGTGRNVRLTQTAYNDLGQPVWVLEGGTAWAVELRKTHFTYNLAGLVTEVRVARPDRGDQVTLTGYFGHGRVAYTITYFDVNGAQLSRTDYTYYANSQLVDTVRQVLSSTASLPETKYHYDGFGRLKAETDPNGNTIEYAYNEAGQLKEVLRPAVAKDFAPGTTNRPKTEYDYDAFGNQTHVRDPHGRVTAQAFDRLDRRTSITHPTYTPPGGTPITAVEGFAYDANGNLVTQTTRRGYQITHTYDDFNRVVSTTNERGNVAGATGNHTSFYQYDLAGNLTQTTSATGAVVNYTYNKLGKVATKAEVVRSVVLPVTGQTQAAATHTTSYIYDDLGQLTRVTTPLGLATNYTYDEVGNQTAIIDPAGATTRNSQDLWMMIGAVTRRPGPRGW